MKKIFEVIKNFVLEFLCKKYAVDKELTRVTEDYTIIKQRYEDIVWGNANLDVNSYCSRDTLITAMSEYLVMVNKLRIAILETLIGSCDSTARTHVNAMLVDVSNIQEEIEFLLSKQGVVHTAVIEPPSHDGIIRYWRNMNSKHSINASLLLTLAIF